MIQSNDSSFVSPTIASSQAPYGDCGNCRPGQALPKKSCQVSPHRRAEARRIRDTFHEDAIYYNNQIVKEHQAAVRLCQTTTAHWVGGCFARQNKLAASDSVKSSGKKQEYENRPEVSMRGPSDSYRG